MKKSFILSALLCLAMLIVTSCSEESKYKEFAINFAHAVNSGDTIQINSLLAQPDCFQFSKVNLAKVNPDSLKLDEIGEGMYQFSSGNNVSIVVTKKGEKFVVEQTRNIFCGEPESVAFALKHNLIKNDDNDKSIYDALHSKEYAEIKAAELEEQKFAKEKEAAQKIIVKTLEEFKEIVNTMQDLYDMDPASLWWSMNNTVLTSADMNKCSLNKHKKYMTPEQLATFERLLKQYNRLMNS